MCGQMNIVIQTELSIIESMQRNNYFGVLVLGMMMIGIYQPGLEPNQRKCGKSFKISMKLGTLRRK